MIFCVVVVKIVVHDNLTYEGSDWIIVPQYCAGEFTAIDRLLDDDFAVVFAGQNDRLVQLHPRIGFADPDAGAAITGFYKARKADFAGHFLQDKRQGAAAKGAREGQRISRW